MPAAGVQPWEQGRRRRRVSWRPALGRGRRGPTRFAPSPAPVPGAPSSRLGSPAPGHRTPCLASGRVWARSGSAFLGRFSAIIVTPFRPQPQPFPVIIVPPIPPPPGPTRMRHTLHRPTLFSRSSFPSRCGWWGRVVVRVRQGQKDLGLGPWTVQIRGFVERSRR